jgi:ribosomal protein S18 acetylase RimI-like enzyme
MAEFNMAPYSPEHFAGVKALWQQAFPDDPPWNAAEAAIPAKLAVQPELFLVALDGDLVVGSIIAGYDGHRGWLYAVAVVNNRCRRGVGTALVRAAKARVRSMGCSKINLQVRSTNANAVAFYRRLGYLIEERTSMGKPIARSDEIEIMSMPSCPCGSGAPNGSSMNSGTTVFADPARWT